jgi:hypothetical protein
MAHIYYPPPAPTQARVRLVQPGAAPAADVPPLSARAAALARILDAWVATPATLQARRFITPGVPLSTLDELQVSMDVIEDAELDELLVSMDVLRSSAPSDLPISMVVQDAGDAFVVSMDVVGEDFEALLVAVSQRPVATFEETLGVDEAVGVHWMAGHYAEAHWHDHHWMAVEDA